MLEVVKRIKTFSNGLQREYYRIEDNTEQYHSDWKIAHAMGIKVNEYRQVMKEKYGSTHKGRKERTVRFSTHEEAMIAFEEYVCPLAIMHSLSVCKN